MSELLVVAVAYLLGSIPFAVLVSRRAGVDLRRAGSGNPGATNVLRTTGPGPAALALALDAAKGAVAVAIAPRLAADAGIGLMTAAGAASIVGHIFPVWLGFRGGKGVATAAGAFAVLTPLSTALAAVAFGVAVAATQYVSVASLMGAAVLVAAVAIRREPAVVVTGAIAAAAVIAIRHRGNLTRLRSGVEPRVGRF